MPKTKKCRRFSERDLLEFREWCQVVQLNGLRFLIKHGRTLWGYRIPRYLKALHAEEVGTRPPPRTDQEKLWRKEDEKLFGYCKWERARVRKLKRFIELMDEIFFHKPPKHKKARSRKLTSPSKPEVGR